MTSIRGSARPIPAADRDSRLSGRQVAPRRVLVLFGMLVVVVPGGAAAVTQDTVPRDSTTSQVADTTLDAATADTVPEAISNQQADVDEEIRSRLQAIFDRVESLGNVDVRVEAGIVRLSGSVASESVAARAVEFAEAQEGALWVVDDIALSTSLSEQLQPTWDRLREMVWSVVVRIPLLLVALLILVLFAWVGTLLAAWGGPAWLHSRNPFLRGIVGRALQAVAIVAGILIALDLLEATALVAAVAGSAGLAGLALGFAFKDIVENYLAGFLLALRRPFEKNDHVIVSDHEGLVVRLTPREAILMTMDGNHVRVPNALIFRSPITNYTRNPLRRFSFDAGIGPVDDLALARGVGIEVLSEMEGVTDDPAPEALVTALGDSSVTVRFLGWVDQRDADYLRVRSEAIRLIKLRLEAAGVSLPAPEYLVRLKGTTEGIPERAPHGAEVTDEARPVIEDASLTQADVSRDDTVERQIEAERMRSDEEDLLEGSEQR